MAATECKAGRRLPAFLFPKDTLLGSVILLGERFTAADVEMQVL